MISKNDLREENKRLVKENQRLKFLASSYKHIAYHYSSISEDHDGGAFARQVMKDIEERLNAQTYKPVNYSISKIFKETNDSYPLYVGGIFEDYLDD